MYFSLSNYVAIYRTVNAEIFIKKADTKLRTRLVEPRYSVHTLCSLLTVMLVLVDTCKHHRKTHMRDE